MQESLKRNTMETSLCLRMAEQFIDDLANINFEYVAMQMLIQVWLITVINVFKVDTNEHAPINTKCSNARNQFEIKFKSSIDVFHDNILNCCWSH